MARRIARQQHNIHLHPRIGMIGQIAEHCLAECFCRGVGQCQIDFQRFCLASHRGNARPYCHDAVIIARRERQFERVLRRLFRLVRKGDDRRQIGHNPHLPLAQPHAIGPHPQGTGAGKFYRCRIFPGLSFKARIVCRLHADARPGARIVHAQLRQRAFRHGDRLAAAGEIDWRVPGIGWRVDPGIECWRCGAKQKARIERRRQPVAPVAACHKQPAQRQRHSRKAQSIRIGPP